MDGSHKNKAKMDGALSTSSHNSTPRSTSWAKQRQKSSSTNVTTRSTSATPLHRRATEPSSKATEEEQRALSDAAFKEWLIRKKGNRPRASPTREQIEKHQRDDARQMIINQWLEREFSRRPLPVADNRC